MWDMRINHREGMEVDSVQKHLLGAIAQDDRGALWSYVEFRETVTAGEVIRDSVSDDLLSATEGTITTITAAGGQTLIDSGEFASNDDFVGAIGWTNGDTVANAAAQGFYVTEMIDDNTIGVEVLHGDADPVLTNGGWETATTATTTYHLYFPGRGMQGDGATDIVRGVVQVDVTPTITSGLSDSFGWVKQTGIGWVKLDTSDAAIPVRGEKLLPAAAGLVIGYTAGGTTADEGATPPVGICLMGDLDGTTDALLLADLRVTNWTRSFRYPRRENPYNAVTIS